MVKYALCISGAIRTFPKSFFIDSIKILLNEIPNLDIFIVFKIQDKFNHYLNSVEGINSIIKHLLYLKPKKIIFVDSFLNKDINSSSYSSQLLLINKSINLASHYSNYDFFIRYRPDFILEKLNLDFENLNENIIYTTRKYDAKASDQVFMFSNKLKNIWWNKLNFFLETKRGPEYHIFNNLPKQFRVLNGPCFHGGLLRNEINQLHYWQYSGYNKTQKIKYKERYHLQISEDTNFENKYKDMLLKKLNSHNFDFLYIDNLVV